MVHTGQVAAAAATDSSRRVTTEAIGAAMPTRVRPSRLTSTGSFRAGSPPPVSLSATGRGLRRLPTLHHHHHHYQTFPTPPPKTPGHRPSDSLSSGGSDAAGGGGRDGGGEDDEHAPTPLPWRQLALLALLSLSEQTALNSISPYLPTMVKSFPELEGDESRVGLYVGLLASAFALAQLMTNLFWGYLSDMIGRKPVMLLGTSFLCVCFALFGFCTKYWHVMVVHVAMGLLNGNAAVVPTCLGELTDRSNQSKAFTWLPVVYSLGSITGPALGGLLVGRVAKDQYPFLAPNILGASLLALSVIVLALWYEETLEDQDGCSEWSDRWEWFASYFKRAKDGAKKPSTGGHDDYDDSSEEERLLTPTEEEGAENDRKDPSDPETWKEIMNRTTVLVLLTYLIFQVSNISFGSLYPIYAAAAPPTGRDLHSDVIGVSLSVAGIFTILFQLILFRPLKARLGNLGTYRGSLLGFAISMALMPWIGYRDSPPPFGVGSSKIWLYVEMGLILVIKNICAVGGLSSVMLLITNSAPSHSSLGTLNGIAQTLSAAGRSFGPLVSGSLFTLSVRVQPKGELLVWGLFGGFALVGWCASYGIRAHGLESTDDGFEDEGDGADEEAATAQ